MPCACLSAARAALEHCRKTGYQVSVAIDKARTAASFKVATSVLARETQAGMPMSGLRSHPRVLAVAGIKAIAEAIEF